MEVNGASEGEREGPFQHLLGAFPNGAPRYDWIPAPVIDVEDASCSKARRPP